MMVVTGLPRACLSHLRELPSDLEIVIEDEGR